MTNFIFTSEQTLLEENTNNTFTCHIIVDDGADYPMVVINFPKKRLISCYASLDEIKNAKDFFPEYYI